MPVKVTDYLTKQMIKKIEPEALQIAQSVLDSNLTEDFIKNAVVSIENKMLKHGSCIIFPSNAGFPTLCREGLNRIRQARQEHHIYFPLINAVFNTITPADPIALLIVATDYEGVLFEWDHFHDLYKRGQVSTTLTRETIQQTDIILKKNIRQRKNRRVLRSRT